MNQEKVNQVIEMIKEGYNEEFCAYTSERSHGNYDDVFDDGVTVGYHCALYEIGVMLGIELPEPHEPEY